MDAALAYVRHIDEVVHQVSVKAGGRPDPEVLAREVLAELGIAQPPTAPLAVQTFIGHVHARGLLEALNDRG